MISSSNSYLQMRIYLSQMGELIAPIPDPSPNFRGWGYYEPKIGGKWDLETEQVRDRALMRDNNGLDVIR